MKAWLCWTGSIPCTRTYLAGTGRSWRSLPVPRAPRSVRGLYLHMPTRGGDTNLAFCSQDLPKQVDASPQPSPVVAGEHGTSGGPTGVPDLVGCGHRDKGVGVD